MNESHRIRVYSTVEIIIGGGHKRFWHYKCVSASGYITDFGHYYLTQQAALDAACEHAMLFH